MVRWCWLVLEHPVTCKRRDDSHFALYVGLPDPSAVTGIDDGRRPEIPGTGSELFISGQRARVDAVHRSTPFELTVTIALESPMPSVMYRPDQSLSHAGDVSFEQALSVVVEHDHGVVVNWISEDSEAWYFNAYCIGPGCTRVSKATGEIARVMNTFSPLVAARETERHLTSR